MKFLRYKKQPLINLDNVCHIDVTSDIAHVDHSIGFYYHNGFAKWTFDDEVELAKVHHMITLHAEPSTCEYPV